MDWQSLLSQIKLRHETLVAIQDEIGSSQSQREQRNESLFHVVTEALDGQVKQLSIERDKVIQECKDYITKTMDMRKAMGERVSLDTRLNIQKPYLQTLQKFKQEYRTVEAAYQERLVTVKKLHDTLAIYTPHLEESFLNVTIPDPNTQVVDVTASYVSAITAELARCTEEYKARLELCQRTANEIVNLWAQLGSDASASSSMSSTSSYSSLSSSNSFNGGLVTQWNNGPAQFNPQSEFDRLIFDHHNNAPEKIGLKQDTLNKLAAKRDELLEEKQKRQSRIQELRGQIEPMWQKLGKEKKDCDTFLRRNRGFSDKVIANYEKELAQLIELKRENMHIFVDAARNTLQRLWDELFFSEDQMAEFTPAFTDIFTDASLAAHEYEVKRLEALAESRQTALSLVKKHMDLIAEKQHLDEASKDPSRLTQRGAQAAGRLLQEEKIRKKLSKELPKIEQDLVSVLLAWEDENGEDFLVYGERYLDVLERLSRTDKNPSRNRGMSATPVSPSKPPARAPSRAAPSRPPSVARSVPPQRSDSRLANNAHHQTYTNPQTPGKNRRPLGTMSTQAASVRSVQESPSPTKPISLEHAHLKMRGVPTSRPAADGGSPMSRQLGGGNFKVPGLPVSRIQPPSPSKSTISNSSDSSMMVANYRVPANVPSYANGHRDFSGSSAEHSASQTSENWETYDEGSEPEEEYDTPRAMRVQRYGFETLMPATGLQGGYSPSRQKRNSSVNSNMSGKARAYIQQQSQRGQDLIAELMEEVQEVDDEWGTEGF